MKYELDLRKTMAKTSIEIEVRCKHEKEVHFRMILGRYLLRFVAWVMGVKMISMDWDTQ